MVLIFVRMYQFGTHF